MPADATIETQVSRAGIDAGGVAARICNLMFSAIEADPTVGRGHQCTSDGVYPVAT